MDDGGGDGAPAADEAKKDEAKKDDGEKDE